MMTRRHPSRTLLALVLLCLTTPASTKAANFHTQNFKLHPSDPPHSVLRPRSVAADTLGNFYAVWSQVRADGFRWYEDVVGSRVRSDGAVEENFVNFRETETEKFRWFASVDVTPGGDLIAVEYGLRLSTGDFSYLQLLDSTGQTTGPARWVDSLMPGIRAHSRVVAITGQQIFSSWQAESTHIGGTYIQRFDLQGNRVGGFTRSDACSQLACEPGRMPGVDHNAGRTVIAWDAPVTVSGIYFPVPLFRIYDDAGGALTDELPASVEPGYVSRCYTLPPDFQAGGEADVAVADNGEFMVVWHCCDGPNPWRPSPWGRIFYPDGSPKTGLISLQDDRPANDTYPPRVAWGSGHYFVLWADRRDDDRCGSCEGGANLYIQNVGPDGAKVGPNYIVNEQIGSVVGFVSDIAVSQDRVFVAWLDSRDKASLPDAEGEVWGQIVSTDLVGQYVPGDVNLDYQLSVADVIYLVTYVFKGGQRPLPGIRFGDVTGDCVTTAADILYYVNFVFKGGPGFGQACGVN